MAIVFDASRQRQPDVDVTGKLSQDIDTAVRDYPLERLNPWLYGQFALSTKVVNAYVRRERGVYTEIWIEE